MEINECLPETTLEGVLNKIERSFKIGEVSSHTITNNPPTLWAIKTIFTCQGYSSTRQTPWYPEGKMIDAWKLHNHIRDLVYGLANAVAMQMFINREEVY